MIIAAQLAEIGHEQEALEIISEIANQGFHDVWWKCWGLARIAFFLSEPLVRQAMEMAQSLPVQQAGGERPRAIATLAFRLAKLGHATEALAILRESISGSIWYPIVLNAITDLVPEQERIELIAESLSVARLLSDSQARVEALDAIGPGWFDLPPETWYSIWKDWLRESAMRTRVDLLIDISSLMPVVAVYGLGSALHEVGMAIHDITRWWP